MRVWVRLIALLALVVAAGVGGVAWWMNQPLAFEGEKVSVTIEPGSSARQIAQAWTDAGVDTSPWLLGQWFKWSGESRKIRAGVYSMPAGTTPVALLQKMLKGADSTATVRFIEGWTFKQLRAELAKAEDLKDTTAGMTDAQLMTAIGAPPGQAAEGRFFPDTYNYQRGSSDLALLKQAYRTMQQRVQEAWAARDPSVPLSSPEELLTLASIVEKETGRGEDRAQVSAVFNNRLRIGMPLQTDPTVIYGMGDKFDGNLRKRDLQTDTPYNTYIRKGLPPTPIALPGKAALEATGHPAPGSKALYFVARGDGTSHFSESLAEHNRAVNKYQRGGAQ